ncbi:MAG: excinuclease ABC subunit A [Candidatus Eisenbacteria bacterium]|nr:excinuclease ABC subunit A [Candidatus Latescibacterota bacterium]MBD3302325.1 excinuclease ABC subunit A [Candidatus Eisenbacteria bacterium]
MASTGGCALRGVRTHNLKGIDVTIPFGRLTVVTGVSGSGKSSLAFDTIYAEGQRRFVDCLATYARQFLERLERPDADSIGHLEPPVALKQTVSVKNARSTVGSMSEISDHFQLLFAHAGELHCVACGAPLESVSLDSAVGRVLEARPEERLCIATEVRRDDLDAGGIGVLLKLGYTRTIAEGVVQDWPSGWFSTPPETVPVVIDRFPRRGVRRSRVAESLQAAWELGRRRARLYRIDAETGTVAPVTILHEGTLCPRCGASGEIPHPSLFNANTALGACPACQGFGRTMTIDRDKVVPDHRRTLRNDAIVPFAMPSRRGWYRRMLRYAREVGVRTETPWRDLTKRERDWVFAGDDRFPGVNGLFRKLEQKRYRMHIRIFLARFRGYVSCAVCGGTRLRSEALAVTVAGKNLADLAAMPLVTLRRFFDSLRLGRDREVRVRAVLREVRARLRVLDEVGLGYLTLGRTARTLSGGETQRLRLASGIGSALTRTLYVLDEPTVGLHARDADRVLRVLRRICASGSSALVVEHDPAVVEGADHLIVLGPEGGERGGELVYEGTPERFLRDNPGYFRTPATERPPVERRVPQLRLRRVHAHNLRINALSIPLTGITGISGVSGSGKSTLLDEVVYRNWRRASGLTVEDVGAVGLIEGFEELDEVILIGQDPLGRSSRSNAVSFVKVLPLLRELLAGTPEARQRKLRPRDFSFNVPGGRCEVCKGIGTVVLEMHFLPDVEVSCEVCKGRRFRADVLEVTYRGRNILALLETTADEASSLFADRPEIGRRLRPLQDVGLGYLRLGQPTSTLSGGEAQRLKLASFLAEERRAARKLFLFDEPTTGLHARDVTRLLGALRALSSRGHAVFVVEHHLGFLLSCDRIIDLGPGAGAEGGRVVYRGPVNGLIRKKGSATGKALATYLRGARRENAPAR